MNDRERLRLAAYLLESDAASESAIVLAAKHDGGDVTDSEVLMAKLIYRLYKLLHPRFSSCRHPDWEKENSASFAAMRREISEPLVEKEEGIVKGGNP